MNLEIIMASIQDEVKKVCDLADGVLDNPSKSVKDIAMTIGLGSFLTGMGSVILGPVFSPVLIGTWVAKKLINRTQEQEKERMLREVIRKQQAVIERLNMELERARNQNAQNRKEIENLKEMLKILERTEEQLRAA